ncbi:MAG: hypothetical protein V3U71_05365 [Cocleimonas sp.]
MRSAYQLTISGNSHLHLEIYKAMRSGKAIELTISLDNKILKQASLSAEPTSFQQTLENTKNKISLLCKRLNISSQQLAFDDSELSPFKKAIFQILTLKRVLFEVLVPTQWIIVYKQKNASKWNKLIPDPKVFHADTFVVYKDNKYTLFYEELKFEDYHGYLMAAELDIENNELINKKVILKLDHHLSYPNVFEENGTYYMIPECADSHRVDLYECTSFPYQWKKKKTLIEGIQAIDPTPLKTKDGWYLFLTELKKGAECNDELSIYKSSCLFDAPFEKLYEEPVISDVTNARMAGHFIQRDGEILRVSQNCGKYYGQQTNINKVIQIENGYKEQRVETLKPNFGARGFHTFNQDHDLIVGDMEILRFDRQSLKRTLWKNIKRVILFPLPQ